MAEPINDPVERHLADVNALVEGNLFLLQHFNQRPNDHLDLQLVPFKYEREDESLIKPHEVAEIAEGTLSVLHKRLGGVDDAEQKRDEETVKYWTFQLEESGKPFYMVEVREAHPYNPRGRKIPLIAYVTREMPVDYQRLMEEKRVAERKAAQQAAARALGPTARRAAGA